MTDDRLQARLAELRREYATGEARLRDLTRQEVVLRETLLRISGAIQVLEELGAADVAAPVSPAPAGADDGADPRILAVG
ncbi:hypothetical protein OHA21_17615 [Actinoplanes sp. NBC_00393]|uniref:hypothetical protein n=1 Tax=Actinoplanes sp. NBC_00393 TaxID=2975953 RepID=UPI002E1D8594